LTPGRSKIYSLSVRIRWFTLHIFKELQINLGDFLQRVVTAVSLEPTWPWQLGRVGWEEGGIPKRKDACKKQLL